MSVAGGRPVSTLTAVNKSRGTWVHQSVAQAVPRGCHVGDVAGITPATIPAAEVRRSCSDFQHSAPFRAFSVAFERVDRPASI